MKKLTIILITTLLISTKAFSFTFDRCYTTNHDTFEESHKEKYQFSVHINKGKILETQIFKDEWLADRKRPRTDKIKNEFWDLTYIDDVYIKGQTANGDQLIFKLNEKKYHNVEITNSTGSLLVLWCELNKSTKSSSNYLDYWWAVILIIAITFFIFTQSGKRLKQIRRK